MAAPTRSLFSLPSRTSASSLHIRPSTIHPSTTSSFSTTAALLAVPKKKTSHSKRRHRQLAGKALKDVVAVVNCPGCGRPKKAHFLCPYCVAEMKFGWLDQYVNGQGKVAEKRAREQEEARSQTYREEKERKAREEQKRIQEEKQIEQLKALEKRRKVERLLEGKSEGGEKGRVAA